MAAVKASFFFGKTVNFKEVGLNSIFSFVLILLLSAHLYNENVSGLKIIYY